MKNPWCRPTKAAWLASIAFLLVSAPLATRAQPAADIPLKSDKIAFEKRQLRVGSKVVTAEIADTDSKREHGLMYRKHLADNNGMLFIFDYERDLRFWMMNTLIPLSIGYFDADKKLIETHEMVPAVMGELHPKTYPSSRPAMYALEMPKGWFKRNGLDKPVVKSKNRAGDKEISFTFVDKK
jgi:hypothetical protein